MIDNKRLAELAEEDQSAWHREMRRRMRAGERAADARRVAEDLALGLVSLDSAMSPEQFRELTHKAAIKDLGSLGAPHPIKAWAICCNAIRKAEAEGAALRAGAWAEIALYLSTTSVWIEAKRNAAANGFDYDPQNFGPDIFDLDEGRLRLQKGQAHGSQT